MYAHDVIGIIYIERLVMVLKIKLKELREKHPSNPSQRVVGDYLGIAEGNYRRLENGYAKSISFESIEKLCKFFSCTPSEIMEYSDDD